MSTALPHAVQAVMFGHPEGFEHIRPPCLSKSTHTTQPLHFNADMVPLTGKHFLSLLIEDVEENIKTEKTKPKQTNKEMH